MAEPVGRPTKYTPTYCDLVKKLCKIGSTDVQIAEFIGVSADTIYEWKKVYPEFSEALKTAKSDFDELVEQSLLHRAIGYTHPEDKIFQYEGEEVIVPTLKHYPPSEVACIFWLKNRRSERWRDKVELSTDDSTPPPISITIQVEDGRRTKSEPTAGDLPADAGEI